MIPSVRPGAVATLSTRSLCTPGRQVPLGGDPARVVVARAAPRDFALKSWRPWRRALPAGPARLKTKTCQTSVRTSCPERTSWPRVEPGDLAFHVASQGWSASERSGLHARPARGGGNAPGPSRTLDSLALEFSAFFFFKVSF